MQSGYHSGFRVSGGYHLFTVEHVPVAPRGAVLMCAPFLEERLFCRPVMKSLAEHLMNAGWHVLRFDPPGEGDSDGDLARVGIEECLDQAQRLALWLRNRAPGPLVLLGVRWGATLALQLADRVGAAGVIAVEPLLDGEAYLQRLLRQNLATQLAARGRVTMDRKALLACSAGGECIEVQGFALGPRLVAELRAFTATDVAPPRTLLIHCDATGAGAPPAWRGLMTRDGVTYRPLAVAPFWFEPAIHDPVQPALRDTIAATLGEWVRELE